MSLKTSRRDHANRMTDTVKPGLKLRYDELKKGNDYRRGYKHAPEYGTFCNFRRNLLLNESASLNR